MIACGTSYNLDTMAGPPTLFLPIICDFSFGGFFEAITSLLSGFGLFSSDSLRETIGLFTNLGGIVL